MERLCFSGGHVKGVAAVGPACPSEVKRRTVQPGVPLLAVSLEVDTGAHKKTCIWIPIQKPQSRNKRNTHGG